MIQIDMDKGDSRYGITKYHGSKRHSRMSLLNRAAQFAPFAALDGYDEAIQEAARRAVVSSEASDGIK